MGRSKIYGRKKGGKKPADGDDDYVSSGQEESEAEDANVNDNAASGEDDDDADTVSAEDQLYVEMYQKMGFREKAALELVLSEEINTRGKLERITAARAHSICKAIRSPGGSSKGAHVTEGAQHNLLVLATVFNNSTRVSRPIGPLDIQAPPNDLFDLHESQYTMEVGWDTVSMADSFKPLTNNDTRRGWKPVFDEFEERAKTVRGKVSHVQLNYLMREELLPEPHAEDPSEDYVDFDAELVSRHPIIKADKVNVPLSELEAGGAKMKIPCSNQDNIHLYSLVMTTYETDSWWIHARAAHRAKDGRRALRLMKASLVTSNALDDEHTLNRKTMLALEYKDQGKNWTLLKYIAAHKQCHAKQIDLSVSHNYPDFTEREKVTALLDGIKTDKYYIPIVNIQNDSFGARINFDKATEMLLSFQAISDGRDKLSRSVSQVEGGGRGTGRGGGRHGGGRGSGAGRGQGRGRGGRHDGGQHDRANRTKHESTAGGRDLNVAKLSNGDWDTRSIANGTHDALARRQTHIKNCYYPNNKYATLEPLERRMLFLNQQAQKATDSGRPVKNVSTVSVDDSAMSQLTTAVNSMTGKLDALTNLSAKHGRNIKQIKAIQDDNDEELLFDDSSVEEEFTNATNPALARNKLKTYPESALKIKRRRR